MPENFGDMVKRFRKGHGWTQGQLAMKTGLTRGHISVIEMRGKIRPRIDTMLKLVQPFSPTEQQELYEVVGYEPPDFGRSKTFPASFADMLREMELYYESLGIVELPIRGTVPGEPFSIRERAVKYYPISKARLGGSEPDTLYALIVSGECFEVNNIYDGDVVIVEEIVGFEDGKMYIVKQDNELVIQRVYWIGDKIALVSPDGERQEFNASDVEIMGRVILSGRWTRF